MMYREKTYLSKMVPNSLHRTIKVTFMVTFFFIFTLTHLFSDEEIIQPVDRLKLENARLKQIEKEISSLTKQVKNFESREYSLLEEVEKYQLMYNLRETELKAINQKLKTVQIEINSIEGESKELKKRIDKNIRYLRIRMRTLYKMGELNNLRLLLSLENPAEIKKGIWYLSRLTTEDRKKIIQLENDHNNLESKRKSLISKKKDILTLKKLGTKKKKQISSLLGAKTSLLKDIRDSRKKREEALTELTNANKKLNNMIQRISTGDLDVSTDLALDMSKFKGLLNQPVKAYIMKDFGMDSHPVFNIQIPHNGLAYKTKTGTRVKTIFNGKVIYSKRFRGYGNLVIVDHTKGYVSFYAHLLKPLVKVGDFVDRNQVIGLSGESGSLTGPKLYFEILKDGKPVDPMIWFAKSKKDGN